MKHHLQLDAKYYCKSEKYRNCVDYAGNKAELQKDYYYNIYTYKFTTKELKQLGIKYIKAWCGNKDRWSWLFNRADKKKVLQYYGTIAKKKNESDAIYMSDFDKELFEWKPWDDQSQAEWDEYSETVEDIQWHEWKERKEG